MSVRRMSNKRPRSAPASTIIMHPPEIVYQSSLVEGHLDSTTPLSIQILLSDVASFALSGGTLPMLVVPYIRRFDGADLEVAVQNGDTYAMHIISLSARMFTYNLKGNTLEIAVARRELPVSKSFGNAPFVFVFHIVPTDELLTTSQFIVASKERAPKPQRGSPKRIRDQRPNALCIGLPTISDKCITARLYCTDSAGKSPSSPTSVEGDTVDTDALFVSPDDYPFGPVIALSPIVDGTNFILTFDPLGSPLPMSVSLTASV